MPLEALQTLKGMLCDPEGNCSVHGTDEDRRIIGEVLADLELYVHIRGGPTRECFDLVSHLHRQRRFSLRAFGPENRTRGTLDHIRKELIEIEATPDDLFEWIDVVLLAFDGAWRAGYTPEEIAKALVDKLAKNEARTWPDWRTADPNKAIEHDRSGEIGAPFDEDLSAKHAAHA